MWFLYEILVYEESDSGLMSDHLILKGTMSFSLGPGNQNIKKNINNNKQENKSIAPPHHCCSLIQCPLASSTYYLYMFQWKPYKNEEFYLYINHELHCMLNSLKYMIYRLWYGIFHITLHINPRPILALWESRVDICDMENAI